MLRAPEPGEPYFHEACDPSWAVPLRPAGKGSARRPGQEGTASKGASTVPGTVVLGTVSGEATSVQTGETYAAPVRPARMPEIQSSLRRRLLEGP
jgi:hypothetical protein